MSEDRDMFEEVGRVESDGGGEKFERLLQIMKTAIVSTNGAPVVHERGMMFFWAAVTRHAPWFLQFILRSSEALAQALDAAKWKEWAVERARDLLEEKGWDLDNARDESHEIPEHSELYTYPYQSARLMSYLIMFDRDQINDALSRMDELYGDSAGFARLFYSAHEVNAAESDARRRDPYGERRTNIFSGLKPSFDHLLTNMAYWVLYNWVEDAIWELHKKHDEENPDDEDEEGEEDGEDEEDEDEDEDEDQGDDWEAEAVVPDDMSAFLSARGLIQPTGESDGQDE